MTDSTPTTTKKRRSRRRSQPSEAAPKKPQVTAAIMRAQTDALDLSRRLLAESRVCHCRECKGLDLRGKATALVQLVVKAMEATLQRSSPQYIAALRLRAECEATMPVCASGGFAMQSPGIIYTKCVRTTPVLSDRFPRAARLEKLCAAGKTTPT